MKTDKPLKMQAVQCCLCESADAQLIGTGEDFEYRTSVDKFSAMQCDSCELVYLNPRPDISEFERIYPTNYHALDFSAEDFGLVHKIRSRLEAKRLLKWCRNLPVDAKIIDIGCGDGFHLNLLLKYGSKSWSLEGVDIDARAAEMAAKSGLKVHIGSVEELELPIDRYDLALMIQTIEHVAEPPAVISAVRKILKPGGHLVVVTDNTNSLDFGLFKKSHWGGYHFPRHWNLFNRRSLKKLAEKAGFQVSTLTTQVSPVNWVFSIHNWLVDSGKPAWMIDQFTLRSTVSLSVFTLLDLVFQKLGRGALLNAVLQKPQ